MKHDDIDSRFTWGEGVPGATDAELGPGELPAPEARFERLAVLGRGGMGEVLRVRDRALERVVAMKVIRSTHVTSPAMLQRFVAEARATAILDHPGVVPVYDVGRLSDGSLYYTMLEVRGRTLQDVIADLADVSGRDTFGVPSSGWTLIRVLDAFVQVCETLAFAHDRGIIHRDLKPSNIMLGEFGEVRVVDWGLVKWLADAAELEPSHDTWADEGDRSTARSGSGPSYRSLNSPTRVGQAVGTVGFMSPEQARGEPIGTASDVYALGAILACIVTDGSVPADPALAAGHLADFPRIPPELASICLRALAADPEARFADASALRTAMSAWVEQARGAEHTALLERAWESVPEPARPQARALLLSLVDPDGRSTARPVAEVESGVLASALTAGLVEVTDGRLALRDAALPSRWARFGAWIEAEGVGLETRHRLMLAAREWAANGRDAGRLWDGPNLAQAEAWQQQTRPDLAPVEEALLAASIRRRDRRRQLGLVGAVGLVGVLVVALWSTTVARGRAERALSDANAARAAEQEALRAAEARATQARAGTLEALGQPHAALALYRLAAARAGDLDPRVFDHIDRLAASTPVARFATSKGEAMMGGEWSPDGTRVAVRQANGWLRVFDSTDGRQILETQYTGNPIDLAWSPDGTRIATIYSDGAVRVVRLSDGDEVVLGVHESTGLGVAWSPSSDVVLSSDYVAAQVWDPSGAGSMSPIPCWTCSWRMATDDLLYTRESTGGFGVFDRSGAARIQMPSQNAAAAVTPGGERAYVLLLTEGDSVLRAVSLPGGEVAWERQVPDADRSSLVLTGDGETLLQMTAGASSIPRWSAADGAELPRIDVRNSAFASHGWSHDGARLGVADTDGLTRIVDLARGTVREQIPTKGVSAVRFSPDDSEVMITSYDNGMSVWSLAEGGTDPCPPGLITLDDALAGDLVLGVGPASLCLADRTGRQPVRVVPAAHGPYALGYLSPLGTRAMITASLEVTVYDTAAMRELSRWTWDVPLVSGILVLDENSVLVSLTDRLQERDLLTGAVRWEVEGTFTSIRGYRHGGRWVFGIRLDRAVEVRDAANGGALVHIVPADLVMDSMAFVRSEQNLVMAIDRVGVARVWRAGEDTPLWEAAGDDVFSGGVLPDGDVWVGRADEVTFHDPETGAVKLRLPGPGWVRPWEGGYTVQSRDDVTVWRVPADGEPHRLRVHPDTTGFFGVTDRDFLQTDLRGVHRWALPRDPPAQVAAQRSNLRVCPDSERVVMVVPWPSDDDPLAPPELCGP